MADLITRPETILEISPAAVRWKRDDCAALKRAGILSYRYELVEGVINRMGQNLGHAGMIQRLLAWLFVAFGSEYVLTQMTIDVRPEDNPTNEPEPDVIVLSRPDVELGGNPRPDELRLVVEASNTTLSYDLNTKARLYARAKIVEYWVVSMPERKVYIHRQPVGGIYRDVKTYSETESVSPLAAPNSAVIVSKLLPQGNI